MFTCKVLDNKTFETKEALFAALKANKDDIFAIKKAITKHSDSFGHNVFEKNVSKSINKAIAVDDNATKISKTVIGNTYYWLDSHDDVHIEGIFTKSISENQKRILHLHDHLQQVAAKVGIPKLVYEKSIPWADLGINKPGNTTSLLMDSDIVKDMNPSIFYQYNNNQIDQHSVGMIYVSLAMCIDSTDPYYKEEFVNWNKYIGMIGNSDKAMEQGFFFAITEAKLKEISAVTDGSNSLTHTLNEANSTEEQPLKSTEHQPQFDLLKAIQQTTFIKS